jgi:hypothetical protein
LEWKLSNSSWNFLPNSITNFIIFCFKVRIIFTVQLDHTYLKDKKNIQKKSLKNFWIDKKNHLIK